MPGVPSLSEKPSRICAHRRESSSKLFYLVICASGENASQATGVSFVRLRRTKPCVRQPQFSCKSGFATFAPAVTAAPQAEPGEQLLFHPASIGKRHHEPTSRKAMTV